MDVPELFVSFGGRAMGRLDMAMIEPRYGHDTATIRMVAFYRPYPGRIVALPWPYLIYLLPQGVKTAKFCGRPLWMAPYPTQKHVIRRESV